LAFIKLYFFLFLKIIKNKKGKQRLLKQEKKGKIIKLKKKKKNFKKKKNKKILIKFFIIFKNFLFPLKNHLFY